jgi:hypothetical protein
LMGDAEANATKAGRTEARESFMVAMYEDIREIWSDRKRNHLRRIRYSQFIHH